MSSPSSKSSDESDYCSDEETRNETSDVSMSNIQSSFLGSEENGYTDVFQDAKDQLKELSGGSLKGFDGDLEFLSKDSIFKKPPSLLGVEEYQIVVAKFIANGISWEDMASVLFKNDQHSQIEKTVRQKYFSDLAEEVEQSMSQLITALCCARRKAFFDYLEDYKKPEISSELWEKVLGLNNNKNAYLSPSHLRLLQMQLKNFKNVKNAENDRQIQKLWNKTLSRWLQLINTLVPHFFDDSVERELLSCTFNWFTCGDMSHSQFNSWKNLFKKGQAISLKKLKQISWEDGHAKEHASLFISLLDDVPTADLTRVDDFKGLLTPFLNEPKFELVDAKSRLKVSGKGMFLSDILQELMKKKLDSVKEVNIYAKYFFGIDICLENSDWHGTNFTILTDKLTVWKASVIDVSGTGYSRELRAPAHMGYGSGRKGDDGVDGRAGESSGNVVILTNQLRYPEKLTLKLNGGTGEGGQNGGAGADGSKGVSISKDDFLKTILNYDSLYFDSWSYFVNYSPGYGWTKNKGTTGDESWIYRTYTHEDGRTMIYSFARDKGWTYSTYHIMFLITGTDGSMGGAGGRNGVSGEGGNPGDFQAYSLKTNAKLKNFILEMNKGKDGIEGSPGLPGNPGVNGNHMAMTDKSTSSLSYGKRESRFIHGESGRDRLQIAYEYSESDKNAYNGLRKHQEKVDDFYTTFKSTTLPTVSHTKATEKRTSSERTTKSQAMNKQTISVAKLVEEFAEVCEGDELNIGDISDFKEFEAKEEEEEEEEEQVQEEVSVVKTLVEDSQEHEKNLRRSIVKPEEVIKEINRAAERIEDLSLVEVIDVWKRIFTVPLSLDNLKKEMKTLYELINDSEFIDKAFEGRRTLPNGMSKQEVAIFIDKTNTKFNAKKELSELEITLDVNAVGSSDLELEKDELTDVVLTHLDEFWMEVSTDEYKTKLIQPFFSQLRDNDLRSSPILKALYNINLFLGKHPDVFKPFAREDFNWADIRLVQDYLKSFLTDGEKDKLEAKEKEEKAKADKKEDERKKKEAKKKEKAEAKAAKNKNGENSGEQEAPAISSDEAVSEAKEKQENEGKSKDTGTKWIPDSVSSFFRSKEAKVAKNKNLSGEQEDPAISSGKSDSKAKEKRKIEGKGEIFAEEKTNWFLDSVSSLFSSKEVNKAFKDVATTFKPKEIGENFADLNELLKNDRRLAERFCIEKTFTNELCQPGSSPQSLVHLYYLTAQILKYNVKLFRYYQPFVKKITIPNDWYNSSRESSINDVPDLIKWSADHELPRVDSEMQKFIQDNGIRCRCYRQMVADHCQVNVQMFCQSGYGKVRLVENLNPEFKTNQRRLIIKDGQLMTITVNGIIRKLRAVMDSCKLSIPLPQSEGQLQLAPYFPDSFRLKVKEWTDAAIIASESEILPRFLQRLFELRGNSMSIVDFQFIVNTFIETDRTFGVSLQSICRRILSKDGNLLDIFLALRVMGSMKGNAPKLDPLVLQLSEIKESRLKALFGSKLHEIPITDTVLTSLVNMLAHADDRVAQLEKMSLQEWVDIANCQRWNSYGPLLKAYGTVGYYITLLDTIGREEGQRLERIIKGMKEKNEKCIILEKLISSITFMISNNEIIFDEKYEAALSCLLNMVSQKYVEIKPEEMYTKYIAQYELRREDIEITDDSYVKMDNIYLITNEVQQHIIKRLISGLMEKEFAAVLPKDDRSLTDLIKLSINPQDNVQAKEDREREMQKIEDILADRVSDDIFGMKLKIIDDKLFELYEKRLRDTQKIAILSAAKSKNNLLSQVNTGEGKSFIISCLAILRILVEPKDTVDIITSSSILAQRDAESMRKLYEAFKIEVGHNCDEDVEKRKLAYKCGVVYGDIARFERDYLLQTFYKKNILGSRTRCNVIVDEVDSMLLDNGSNMLYLSHNVPGLELLDSLFVYLHKLVNLPSLDGKETDFSSLHLRQKVLADMTGLVTKEDVRELLFDKKETTIIGKVWRILATQNVINSEGILQEKWDNKNLARELLDDCGKTLTGRIFAMLEIIKNRRQEIRIPGYLKPFVITHLDEFIKNAKQGLFLKHNDEYVVDLDRTGRVTDLHPVITIIDKGTGTDLSTSQWSEGLHQFLQLKHGCRLTPLSLKAVFVSNVSYLRNYKRLNGFSGTLGSVEESNSLVDLYNADLLKIPTWKPKKFNENAPILASSKENWIKEIFAEVCDQVIANRSVLVICQSIAKVEELNLEFKKQYNETSSPSKKLTEAFKKIIVYTREFDDVDFSAEEKLPCCRIIISTNLAGRGTDIALCKDLEMSGGLHVIVSFLPENSRIENQAYGRAARCGQEGSGQIICLVQEEDNGANNIFQLKQFRDNAEVHRLRSLKQFYDYHIAVEETCLKLFQDHCNQVMESVHSASEELTITQIIYFALLDEWAAWLDSKAEEIRQCEKNKNDVLKDNIVNSVKQFLEAHPLPTSKDYSQSLGWIKCPQPLLSIALVYFQFEGRTETAKNVLNHIIEKFPDFEAEAYYYKGIIEQWKIREALEHQPGLEKDKNTGKMVEGKAGMRLKAVNWLLENLIFSDDCPDNWIQLCMEKIHTATEFFLLSRSLFATRIRKKNEMMHIVKILQQQSTAVASRGFAAQQEEAIAVLECFIGSIDDILGHRAKPEDVKIGDENPHITIRRYREIIKRADIITPPQLANKISAQQYYMLANNHCLPVTVLKQGFQKIYSNEKLPEYEGQKCIRAEEVAEIFLLPSIRGFWESLRRAGCFLAENVLIAVKKKDKEKVPVLNGIQPMEFKLGVLQLQLSTENLEEYNLYDVHGAAAVIKQNDVKNAELQEAQEAGLVHIEVIATVNPAALSICHSLDQFSCLTIEAVATELAISYIEAEWIMEVLVNHGVVEKRLVEVTRPLTPDEIVALNRKAMIRAAKPEASAITNGEQKMENGDKSSQNGHKHEETNGTISSAEDSGVEETKEDKQPIEFCLGYFPVTRISCDMFPSNMRLSIQMMLSRNFAYHYALASLKTSIFKTVEGEKVSHQICLPTDPYADLYHDLENLGIVQHSRVTSTLTEIYKPDEEYNDIVKRTKKMLGAETETEQLKHRKKLVRLKAPIHYISPIVYKQLEPKMPKLCSRKCTLIATSSYLEAKNVPASAEIRKAVANGLRKVAIIKEKNWWRWVFGIFMKVVTVVLSVVSIATDSFIVSMHLFPGIIPLFPVIIHYIRMVLAAIAAVKTTLYCISLLMENQKISSTLNLELEEEFHILRTYHESALSAPKKTKLNENQRKEMEKTTTIFINGLIAMLEKSTHVTQSDEDISQWVDALEDCAKNSTHLPLLQQSIESWFKSITRNMKVAQFEGIFNQKSEEESKKLPRIDTLPNMMFAFSSLLISEVNTRKKTRGKKTKKAISTTLDFSAFPVQSVPSPLIQDARPFSFALSKTLKKLLSPMIEENIAGVIDPALSGIDIAWRKNQEDKIEGFEQDEECLKKKLLQHSAERLAKDETVDFLATDLHNIFQRIAFRKLSKPMLQHMVRFNYPLSPHCAKDIFDACVKILHSVDSVFKQIEIELKRNDQTVFTYSALKIGCTKLAGLLPLTLGLEKDSFNIFEVKELVKSHRKYHHGLFQALCDHSTKFSDNFALDPQAFVELLHESLAAGLDSQYQSDVDWNVNEKLNCAVAIW